MDVVIGRLRLKPGRGETFWSFVPRYVAVTRAIPGCHTCEIAQSHEDPDLVILTFVYDTPEAHRALMGSAHEAEMLALLNDVAINASFDNYASDGRRTDDLVFPLGASP